MELIFDTNILMYLRGSPSDNKTKKARNILKAVRKGLHTGVISPPVLMELYYKISDSDNEINAKDFIKHLLSTEGIKIIDIVEEMGMIAGEFYYKYNIRPSTGLSDEEKKKKGFPSGCDCLIASINKYSKKYRTDTCVCSNDGKIKNINEIDCDFFGIPTKINY